MHEHEQLPEPDRIPGLDALAHHGERHADAPPVEQIRACGDRRRRRRHTAVGAGALAVVLLAGGVFVGGSGWLDSSRVPDPAQPPPIGPSATPSSTSTPQSEVGPQNVVPADDIPLTDPYVDVEQGVNPGKDRGPDSLTVCQQEPLSALDPTSSAFTAYQLVPPDGLADDNPLKGQPNLYLAALQFDDPGAALSAERTLRSWLTDCPEFLAGEGLAPKEDEPGTPRPITWYEVSMNNAEGGFVEQIYNGADPRDDGGYFEGVGLARVGDRLVIGVHLLFQSEFYWATPGEEDQTGADPHPLDPLLPVAVEYLTR